MVNKLLASSQHDQVIQTSTIPQQPDSHSVRALRMYQSGNRQEAEQLCREALKQDPLQPGAIYLLGVLALETRQLGQAIQHLHHASFLLPNDARVHHALGEAFRLWGDPENALQSFRNAIRLDAKLVASHNAIGVLHMDEEKWQDAEAALRQAIQVQPAYERAHLNLGRVLQELDDVDGARACFLEAIRLKPDYPIALNNLGVQLHQDKRYDEAIPHLRKALQLQPNYPEAHFNLGNSLFSLSETTEAVTRFQEAVRLRPDYIKANHNLGLALSELGRKQDAYLAFRAALKADPKYIDAQVQIGHLLHHDQKYAPAVDEYTKALTLDPNHAETIVGICRVREMMCDWRSKDADLRQLETITQSALDDGEPGPVSPFHAVSLPWDMERVIRIGVNHTRSTMEKLDLTRKALHFSHPKSHSGKLRIGYLSADFHNHATSHLMQTLFGMHDREQFEIFVYSHGTDDDSIYRKRIRRDADVFRDVKAMSIPDCARKIHGDGIHILIDLKGYTANTRMSILALRPAPIQCHYIGFPGPIGGEFVDYGIADPTVTPPEVVAKFPEKLVLMPQTYYVTDDEQPIADIALNRVDHGLPKDGFVYCCFNQNYKIEPTMFSVWMRILQEVPGSVLWLFSVSEEGEKNLTREAEARGVDRKRLVFAVRKPKDEHLARMQLADLFLDTRYYNAHTTGIDSLWAGVPLLTCQGNTWASRVGSALLTAVDLPELITSSLEEYEKLAIHLAKNPSEHLRLKEKLAETRKDCSLFNTKQFARRVEKAYKRMWETYVSGKSPEHIILRDNE